MALATTLFAVVAAISLATHCTQSRQRRSAVMEAAGLAGKSPSRPRLTYQIILFAKRTLTGLGRRISPSPDEKTRRLLEESGAAWTPHYLMGARVAMGLALAAPVILLGPASLLLAPALFAAGYQAPMLALKRKRARRWERVARELPEIVDLMAVLCFAGESLLQALRHAASACAHRASREEIGRMLEGIGLGESFAETLRRFYDHPCREMRRFSRTLIRAEEFGAPIAETMEELAVEFRNGRREKDRMRASRASVLILFPLVFLILPSFLLLTVGGIILAYTL